LAKQLLLFVEKSENTHNTLSFFSFVYFFFPLFFFSLFSLDPISSHRGLPDTPCATISLFPSPGLLLHAPPSLFARTLIVETI
jgi:hypothetical protein